MRIVRPGDGFLFSVSPPLSRILGGWYAGGVRSISGCIWLLALVAAAFIGFSPCPRPLTGLMVPKSHRSSFADSLLSSSSVDSSESDSELLLPCLACHLSCRSISSVRYVVFFALRTKRCLSSSLADGLRFGSFRRHCWTKSLNSGLKLPSSTGGGFFGIKKRTFMGWMSEYGGSPNASSSAVIPRDQISALWSYPDCLITSGAIQKGVPTKVFFFVMVAES